jgi:aspartyl-tRNA(Asn)/glutamyl-tRNA(Gln) amidotransferase subunit C
VALLARLALTEEEREKLRDQLSSILEHINVMSEADTGQVAATASVLPLENIMRADKPRQYAETQELVDNAPAHEGSNIRVRAVLDTDE